MKADIQLDWTDYLKAQQLHLQPSLITKVLLFFLIAPLVCIVGVEVSLTLQGEFRLQISLIVLLAVGIYFLIRQVIMPRRTRRIFFQQKDLHTPFQVEITSTGITSTNEYGHGHRPWGQFIKWKEDEQLFMLYYSDVLFFILPKRYLEDVEAVRQLIIENNVPLHKKARGGSVLYLVLFLVIVAWVIFRFLQNF